MERVEIHASARRHGVKDEDLEHAVSNAIVIVDLDRDADPPKVLCIGADRAGNLLEIIWIELAEDRALANPRDVAAPRVLRLAPSSGGRDMTKAKTYRTKTGRELSDADIEAISHEVEDQDYDVEDLKTRRRGRPAMGSGPADVVPVRLDPELREAVEARASEDETTTSDVIRRALREFLHVG